MNTNPLHVRTQEPEPVERVFSLPTLLAFFLICIVLASSLFLTDGVLFAGTSESCESLSRRPCYDKKTSNRTSLLSFTKGANSFDACTNNSAPNATGDFIQKTVVCDQERVIYCHDGRSANFLRKFSGNCLSTPTPEPPPPAPTPEPSPITAEPFQIVAPNGAESLPFGSEFSVQWKGGTTSPEWPIHLSIINETRTKALRELVVSTTNDRMEPWIVDLPLGRYILYGQGCRFCPTDSQWDYSDAPFNVVEGATVGKVESSYPLNQSMVVLSPSGGETWAVNSSQLLKWSGGVADWAISISLVDVSSNSTYTTIFSNLVNDGAEAWTVPAYVPPGSYNLYIDCTNCPSPPGGYTGGYYAYSFQPFTIR